MKESLKPAEFLNQERVYFVGSNTDDSVLVAIHPRYYDEAKLLTWWDTMSRRAKQVSSITIQEGMLNVVDIKNNFYVFVPLNLDLYNNVVKPRLSKPMEFSSHEEMIAAFEQTVKR